MLEFAANGDQFLITIQIYYLTSVFRNLWIKWKIYWLSLNVIIICILIIINWTRSDQYLTTRLICVLTFKNRLSADLVEQWQSILIQLLQFKSSYHRMFHFHHFWRSCPIWERQLVVNESVCCAANFRPNKWLLIANELSQ